MRNIKHAAVCLKYAFFDSFNNWNEKRENEGANNWVNFIMILLSSQLAQRDIAKSR